jgi:hypothetical protein
MLVQMTRTCTLFYTSTSSIVYLQECPLGIEPNRLTKRHPHYGSIEAAEGYVENKQVARKPSKVTHFLTSFA